MKTLSQIIEAAKDGFQPEPLDAYYTILALDLLLTAEHELLGLMTQAGSIGKPFSSQRSREAFNMSMTRLKLASTSELLTLLGEQNDPQTPEYQERRQKMKETKKKALAVAQFRKNRVDPSLS